MRDAEQLMMEVQRIWRTADEMVLDGFLKADVLQCLTALECAAATAKRPAGSQTGLEYRPADLDAVRDFVDRYPDLNATAADIYRSIHNHDRDPSTAEARSVAVALRRLGLVGARSNGRTIWRHK